jgi:NADPH2:quinone reductase
MTNEGVDVNAESAERLDNLRTAPLLLSQKGSLFRTRPSLLHYIARREELEVSANELLNVVASGKVRININQRFALQNAAEAHQALEARATSGSTILTI